MSGESGNHVEYYVLKQGETIGPLSEEDLRAGLSDGRFAAHDFVQTEGRVAWQPLGSILNPQDREMKGAIAPDWSCILKWAWVRLRYNLDGHSMDAGLVCVLVGALSLALSRWPFVFWLPWFLAAAVVGFALIRGKREGYGALLLVAVVGVPMAFLIFGRRAASKNAEHVAQEAHLEQPARLISAPPPQPAPLLSAIAATPAPATPAPPVPAAPTPAPVVAKAAPEVVPLPTPTPRPAAAPISSPPPREVRRVAVAATPWPATARATPAPAPAATSGGSLFDSILSFFGLGKESTPSSALAGGAVSSGASDFMQGHNDAFVIVKGAEGSGSGFICKVGNQTWLFTNIHVMADLKQPAITALDNTGVAPGLADLAAGPDLVRFALPKPPAKPLEAITNLEANVHIGDEVAVLGNSGGGGVVTSLTGKIVGIGPDRLEVTAEFIPGNSGSPIIHVKTGKVIGIATYLTRRYEQFTSNPSAGSSSGGKLGAVVVRRYGYRIENVAAWEPVNWAEFRREADQMASVSRLTGDLFDFLSALRNGEAPRFATPELRRPAEDWHNKMQNTRMSATDRRSATETFLNALRFIARGDVAAANAQIRYTYFRNQLRDEQKVRDLMGNAFDAAIVSIPSSLNRPAYNN